MKLDEREGGLNSKKVMKTIKLERSKSIQIDIYMDKIKNDPKKYKNHPKIQKSPQKYKKGLKRNFLVFLGLFLILKTGSWSKKLR